MRTAFPQAGRLGGSRSALALTFMSVGAFCLGGWLSPGQCLAQTPAVATAPPGSAGTGDPGKRVVAYIFDNIPITREELGEYLIERYGAEKLNLLVNKRIIEKVCVEQHIEVTASEVEADLAETLKGMNLDRKDFINKVLAQYHRTLFEWKEDVIKPRLLLTKLCRNNIQITEEDLHNEFECQYGEKIDCRAIIYPKTEEKNLLGELGQRLRSSDEEFDRAARNQPLSGLALTGGQIKPISRHSGPENIEKAAFSLRPGEVSEMLITPQGLLILKCVQRIPADPKFTFDKEREALQQAVLEKKLPKEIHDYFERLNAQAKPKMFMKPQETEKELVEQVQKNLHDTKEVPGAHPQGN